MKAIPTYGTKRSAATHIAAIAASVMLVVMLVAQLYGYEHFSAVLAPLVGSDGTYASIVSALVVIAELLALPYLLGMYLSTLMRVMSAVIGLLIAGFWLFTSLTNAHATNSGLFSDAYVLPGGLLAALWPLLLFGLVFRVILADSNFHHATS